MLTTAANPYFTEADLKYCKLLEEHLGSNKLQMIGVSAKEMALYIECLKWYSQLHKRIEANILEVKKVTTPDTTPAAAE
jgi:hypothetical protein